MGNANGNSVKTAARWARTAGLALAAGALASAAARPPAQSPVPLGASARYAVLAGSLVSNIPGSAVKGDVGLSPAGGSMITGFGGGEVSGTIYTVDATGPAGSVPAATDLTAAKGDLTRAYNDAAGRTPVPEGPFLDPGSGNMGGMTLQPGLYKFTSAASITGSDLTLSGGPTEVWIFQIAAELVVGNGIQVILAGGARPENIFWQVGTSATLGTTSVFKGTLMADQSITLNTGAVLDGRALASIAAVTLASNAITRPSGTSALARRPAHAEGARLRVSHDATLKMATFDFAAPSRTGATLTLLDPKGRIVRTLFHAGIQSGTTHRVRLATGDLARGLHISRLDFDGKPQLTRTLVLF